ncbi:MULTISPECIES: hypothetical protein [Nostoc]|uniref:hypothetical protein n=1 Tax=Nostoc TaxID=1177 RepID=UPI0015D47955
MYAWNRHRRAIATTAMGNKTIIKALVVVAEIDKYGATYLINADIKAEIRNNLTRNPD